MDPEATRFGASGAANSDTGPIGSGRGGGGGGGITASSLSLSSSISASAPAPALASAPSATAAATVSAPTPTLSSSATATGGASGKAASPHPHPVIQQHTPYDASQVPASAAHPITPLPPGWDLAIALPWFAQQQQQGGTSSPPSYGAPPFSLVGQQPQYQQGNGNGSSPPPVLQQPPFLQMHSSQQYPPYLASQQQQHVGGGGGGIHGLESRAAANTNAHLPHSPSSASTSASINQSPAATTFAVPAARKAGGAISSQPQQQQQQHHHQVGGTSSATERPLGGSGGRSGRTSRGRNSNPSSQSPSSPSPSYVAAEVATPDVSTQVVVHKMGLTFNLTYWQNRKTRLYLGGVSTDSIPTAIIGSIQKRLVVDGGKGALREGFAPVAVEVTSAPVPGFPDPFSIQSPHNQQSLSTQHHHHMYTQNIYTWDPDISKPFFELQVWRATSGSTNQSPGREPFTKKTVSPTHFTGSSSSPTSSPSAAQKKAGNKSSSSTTSAAAVSPATPTDTPSSVPAIHFYKVANNNKDLYISINTDTGLKVHDLVIIGILRYQNNVWVSDETRFPPPSSHARKLRQSLPTTAGGVGVGGGVGAAIAAGAKPYERGRARSRMQHLVRRANNDLLENAVSALPGVMPTSSPSSMGMGVSSPFPHSLQPKNQHLLHQYHQSQAYNHTHAGAHDVEMSDDFEPTSSAASSPGGMLSPSGGGGVTSTSAPVSPLTAAASSGGGRSASISSQSMLAAAELLRQSPNGFGRSPRSVNSSASNSVGSSPIGGTGGIAMSPFDLSMLPHSDFPDHILKQDETQWEFLKTTLWEYFEPNQAAQCWNYLEQKMRVAATTFKKNLVSCRLHLFEWLKFDLPDTQLSSLKRRFAWGVAHAIREPWFLGSVHPVFSRKLLVHQFRHSRKPVFVIRLSYTVKPWLVLESVHAPVEGSNSVGLNVCKTLIKYYPCPTKTGLLFWLDTINGDRSASPTIYELAAYVEQKTGWQPFARDFYNQDELPCSARSEDSHTPLNGGSDPSTATLEVDPAATDEDIITLETLPMTSPEVLHFMSDHWGLPLSSQQSPVPQGQQSRSLLSSNPPEVLPSPMHGLNTTHPYDTASPQFTQLSRFYNDN